MKIRDWDEAGLEPAIGHQGDWLSDELSRLDSAEIAVFVLADDEQPATDLPEGHLPRRFLVASVLGLLDATARHDESTGMRLRSVLVPWPAVEGLELVGDTTLDGSLRHRTRLSLRVGHPHVNIEAPEAEDALIAFWRACVLRAGRPPTEQPKDPE